ncbi:MAG: hypothetical protein LQ340_006381 [Diploschistes diacapsis]|nr:MAG: hypothetical protein LQ340_006381 [Diploschistes diacapsis]
MAVSISGTSPPPKTPPFTNSIVYAVVICIAKVAILCLYRRVFSTHKWSLFDLVIMVLIGIMIIFYTTTSFLKIFQCTPRARIYDRSIPGTCIDSFAVFNASGYFNTVTDFLMFFLPVWAVWNLKVSARKKVLVVLAFTFGLCAPVFSLIGLIVRLKVAEDIDSTWNEPQIVYWSQAELVTATLCVCFPEVTPLFCVSQRQRYKNNHRHPSASILDGTATSPYSGRSRSKRVNCTQASFPTIGEGGLDEGGPYIELGGGPKRYRARAIRTEHLDEAPRLQGGIIHVDHEVTVVSRPTDE